MLQIQSTADLRPIPGPLDPIIAIIVALIAGVALLAVCVTARSPRHRTLQLLFLYLGYGVIEVVVKRLAHFSWFLYPIKYSLFFAVIISWAGSRDRTRQPLAAVPFAGVLGAYLALAAVQVFNPIQANVLVGVLGWLSDFAFVSFYFVAFDVFDELAAMRKLMYVTAALGILSAAVCFAEQWYGPDELMRLYPTFVHLVYFAPAGGGVTHRPALLSPYNEIFAVAAMVGLIESRRGPVWLWAIGIAACVVANLLHAVRIGWFTGVAILALLSLFNRQRRIVTAALIAASIAVAVNVGMTVSDGQIARSLTSATKPLNTFQQTRLWGVEAIPIVAAAYPFGVGVGEASPGVRFLDTSGITSFGTHNYLADLAGQMSILGPLLLLIFSARLIMNVGRYAWHAKPGEWRAYVTVCFAIFTAFAVSLFGGGGLGSYPVNEYFWLASGAAITLTVAHRRHAARHAQTVPRRPSLMLVHRRGLTSPRETA